MVCVTNEQTETMAHKRARFEKLAMPAVNALYRQAMKLTNNPEDAQDLVQDAYERGFKAFDSFQPGSNFEAWMITIERNAYFNQYAKAKRRPKRANDSTGEYDDWDIYSAAEHSSEGLRSAEQEYLDNFAPDEILRAFDKLSPERQAGVHRHGDRRQVLPAGGRRAGHQDRHGDEPAQPRPQPAQTRTGDICERTWVWRSMAVARASGWRVHHPRTQEVAPEQP
jgi:RNA polymerase sigma factor (sigma-70 family)